MLHRTLRPHFGICCLPSRPLCSTLLPHLGYVDEIRFLQTLFNCTQERQWVTTNLGPARSEAGPSQAPIQDVDSETHFSMHLSLRLVCSNRPVGSLLSCLDSPSTQTVSPLCVRRASISMGPPLRAIPVASCLHQGRGGSPRSVKGSKHLLSQLPQHLAYTGPVSSAVVRTQGHGAQSPQPVGASGQMGKEHQPPRRSMSPCVTCMPSPPLESEASEVASRCSCPRRAQSCSRRALTSARPSGRMTTPPRGSQADFEMLWGSSGRPVCLPGHVPQPAVLLPVRGDPRHRCAGTQLASGPTQICVSPSEPSRTDPVQGQGG